MDLVLHAKVTLADAQWSSIAQLMEEAARHAKLHGLAEHRIDSAWRMACPDHEPPPELKYFLLRAGADAPFMNRNFEDSYRPEHYQDNRRSADQFVGCFSQNDTNPSQCLDEEGSLRAAIVVIACDVIGETYYCMDASNSHSPVFLLHAPHGVMEEKSMTMLEFLRLELINYWIAQPAGPR